MQKVKEGEIKTFSKYKQTELNNKLKELYTRTNWDLFMGYNDDSAYEN